MTPDPRLAPGGIAELAACVAALHDAGIEVLLDVVLNHSGEGDARGPTVSLRGLDNATYYRTVEGDAAAMWTTPAAATRWRSTVRPCCGWRSTRCAITPKPPASTVIVSISPPPSVATTPSSIPAAPLLAAIAQDPVLRELKLVAEPWDVGAGGYRLGAFPAGWREWNDRYRDAVRRFWRGDAGMTGELATRIAGSSEVFAAAAAAADVLGQLRRLA